MAESESTLYDPVMFTVGIETSGQSGSVALVDGGRVLIESSLSQTGRRHARTLVSELKSLFEQVGRRPRDAECVAVSIGPGSFTGLRVGVVCAKTFAYATGSRIVAVDTLEAIAAAAPNDVTSVVTLVDAMRGDAFHACYERGPATLLPPREGSGEGHVGSDVPPTHSWVRRGDIGLASWRTLIPTIPVDIPLTGPLLVGLPPGVLNHPALPATCWQPTAAIVARIGEREALAGRVSDLWSLEPLYIRKSAAEEQREQAIASEPRP